MKYHIYSLVKLRISLFVILGICTTTICMICINELAFSSDGPSHSFSRNRQDKHVIAPKIPWRVIISEDDIFHHENLILSELLNCGTNP